LKLATVHFTAGIDALTIHVGCLVEMDRAHFPSIPTSMWLIHWRWWRVVSRKWNRWLVKDHLMMRPLTGTFIATLIVFNQSMAITYW